MTAATAAPPIHDLLLALAGRLDDDLLAWARELLAVGEADQAVELVTAALAAERVVLPPTLRAALVAAAQAARADLDAGSALAEGAVEEGTRHRFDAAAAPDDTVVAVLTALPARRIAGCTVHLTWRRTPAGAAPGPLPRAVVLVEADPERSVDVLAYLLATELDRAGAPASVEVFATGRPLPAYHATALRNARVVVRSTAERSAAAQAPAGERPSPVPGRHQTADATSLFGAADAPAAPFPDPRATDLFGPPGPPPAPPERRGPPEPPRPAGRRRRPEPASDGARPSPPADVPPTPHLPDAPEPVPDTDPFHGPLQIPLLAPLLDPTGPDPTGPDLGAPGSGGPGAGPVAAAPERPVPAERGAGGADTEQATPAEPGSPPAGPVPAAPAVPEEWEEDWRSGEWAMPRTPRPAPAADRPGPDGSGAPDGPDPAGADPAGAEPAGADLPRRTERARRRPETDAPGAVPPGRPAGPDGVSLFDSPTARVAPSPGPRPSPADGGGHAAPPPRPAARSPLFPGRPGEGPVPFERLGRPPGDRPTGDDPLFGPGTPDVPLFGGAPGPSGRAPERPAPDEPRPGRRRRPESPAPFPAMDDPLSGHVPAPSRPGDDPEPPALLHGTEGDLMAQLQAELAAREQRPRPYRRAGRNGSTHTVNGHGPEGDRPPPDLAS